MIRNPFMPLALVVLLAALVFALACGEQPSPRGPGPRAAPHGRHLVG